MGSTPQKGQEGMCLWKMQKGARTLSVPLLHLPVHSCQPPPGQTTTRRLLTSPGRLLSQLQPVDGQPVHTSADVALLPLALHAALRLAHVHGLDFVSAVAFGPELQPCIQVAPGGREQSQSSVLHQGQQDSTGGRNKGRSAGGSRHRGWKKVM